MAGTIPGSNEENAVQGPLSGGKGAGDGPIDDLKGFRKQFLKHEALVKGIGFAILWSGINLVLYGYFFSVPEAVLLLGLPAERLNRGELSQELAAGNGRVVMYLGWVQFVIGLALIKLHNWARITVGFFAIPGLISFPIFTLISGYILFTFFSEKGEYVCSSEYKKLIAETPTVRAPVWVMILVIVGFLLICNYPWVIDAIFG